MALLNYSALYSSISSYLNATSGSIEWLKIFVSPDANGGGHFITHGIDFGASYAAGQRGLVPQNGGVLTKTFLRGDGWSALWSSAGETAAAGSGTAAQLAANIEQYLQSTLVSAYDIKQWITQSFTANDAMRFKGVISIDGSGNITSTTNGSGFPTSCEVGDTYKVSGNTVGDSSKIAGQPVSTGDLVVCIKDGSGANLNDAQYWTIVQNNVEHLITYTFNGTAFKLYAQSANDITLYAPTTAGTAGQVLTSAGTNNSPTWVNASTLVVAEAAKVTHVLNKGNGISMTNQGATASSYDGSATITISLSPATTSVIGGVIIDGGTNSEAYKDASNISHTAYPTISVSNTGEIYLTKSNIVNALGYDPISAIPVFTASVDGLVPMASAANKQSSAATSSTYLLGADAKWYKLPTTAFSSTWRAIKVNGTQILSTDTSTNPLDLIAGDHVTLTAGTGNDAGKVTLAAIWRDIQIHAISNGTIGANVTSIGDNDPVVFDNSDSIFTVGETVTVGSGANATQKTVIKSYITWYNIDTGEYELV